MSVCCADRNITQLKIPARGLLRSLTLSSRIFLSQDFVSRDVSQESSSTARAFTRFCSGEEICDVRSELLPRHVMRSSKLAAS